MEGIVSVIFYITFLHYQENDFIRALEVPALTDTNSYIRPLTPGVKRINTFLWILSPLQIPKL